MGLDFNSIISEKTSNVPGFWRYACPPLEGVGGGSSYLQVLFVLGLEQDLSMVAASDPLGRKLQDAGILIRKRAPKRVIN